MKKAVLTMVVVLMVGLFAGCSGSNGSGGKKELNVISVRNTITGDIISLGDTREQVEKITGSEVADEITFEEDGVLRTSYWDNAGDVDTEGIMLDYLDGKVVAIRLMYETFWEITGGATPTMPQAQIEQIYAENKLRKTGSKGGVFLAYKADLTPIPYAEDAPYTVRLTYKDDLCDIIVIQDNVSY